MAITEAEVQDQIRRVAKIENDLLNYAALNTPSYLSDEDALVLALHSSYGDEVLAAVAGLRARLNAAAGDFAGIVYPLLKDYAEVRAFPDRASIDAIMARLFVDFVDNAKSVKARKLTYGSVTPSVGTGAGTWLRATVDGYGYDIEACTPEAKKAVCVVDRRSGSPINKEVFELRGAAPGRDALKYAGSGRVAPIAAVDATDSAKILSNPSFSTFSGTTLAVPTAIQGWTPSGAIGNFEVSEAEFYRGFQGDTTPRSVRFKTNDTLSQPLSVQNRPLDQGAPYLVQIAFKRESACDGNLKLLLGNAPVLTVALVAQAGWTLARLPLDTNIWYRNFNKQDLTLSIQLVNRTVGTLYVDDVILVPFTGFDGLWYSFVGTDVPFMVGDSFAWTDAYAGSGGILQDLFCRKLGRYLPYKKDGTETWADPTSPILP